MHNLRKLKKKKKTQQAHLNPEELAQQKLFQISHMQDQQEQFNESSAFISKIHQLQSQLKLTQTTQRSQQIGKQKINKKERYGVNYSNFLERAKSMEINNKTIGHPKIRFIFLEKRTALQSKLDDQPKRIETTRSKEKYVDEAKRKCYSCESARCKRPVSMIELQRMRQRLRRGVNKEVVNAFQVKNIKLIDRYSTPYALYYKR